MVSSNKDLILANIRKQLSTNQGQISITNKGGSWQWSNSQTGAALSSTNDATNYALSQAPGKYITSMNAASYNLAKGLFGGPNVPDELIEVLANLATYYHNQTGQPLENLFRKGVMMNDFLATINSVRNPASQLGYVGINPTPNWAKNPTLGPTIAAAILGS
jgi:hypothetical protein